MQSNLTLKDLIPAIKEVVVAGGEATFKPFGSSMRPMLYGGRDEIILIKPTLPLKKYDLPLYTRVDGSVILHRVVKVKKSGYVIRGDNTYSDETGITDQNIVAVVSRFRRNGKWHSVNDKSYLLYIKVWTCIYPLRRFIKRVWWKLKRIIGTKKAGE